MASYRSSQPAKPAKRSIVRRRSISILRLPTKFVAVCANDATDYPDDAFDKLAIRWRERNYGFPYLHDEPQDVARAFGAVCTPDIFVFDAQRRLAYRGRIDDSWKDESKVTRRELATAIEALLAGKRPSPEQRPSMGCSIKWRLAA